MDKEKEALFDVLDIVAANQDQTVAALRKREILTPQQEKRITYLMNHPGRRNEVLAEWKEARKVWLHPALKTAWARWERSIADGVCDWCGSEDVPSCIQEHIMRDANAVVNAFKPKPPPRKKSRDATDKLAQSYFDEAMGD